MHKEYLLTPGPTQIPERILQAMHCSQLHHRTEIFKQHLSKALEGLRWLTDCSTQPIILTSSGTGGLEAVIANIARPGSKILAINAGTFAERWIKIARRYEANVVEISAPEGNSPPLDQIKTALKQHSDTELFLVQCCETSTTVMHPVAQIAELVKEICPQALVCVDAISALGTVPLSHATMPIDIIVGASQKALGLPPGLAFLTFSNAAWQKIEQAKRRSFYFDLIAERDNQNKGATAWTPATTIILGLNESLTMFKEEGIEHVHARHSRMSRMTRAGLHSTGCELLANDFPSTGVTGAIPPNSVAADALRSSMLKNHGVRIAGGQGSYKAKAFRIGHMGYVNEFDVLTALTAVELSLENLGVKITRGAAASAALQQWK